MPDKPLFTPGPLTTSASVKQAMLRDLGSRDGEFIKIVQSVRDQLLALAGVSPADGYEAVLMQGSGTFAIESVISSITPAEGKWLVIINGAYGQRIANITTRHRIASCTLQYRENELPELNDVERLLSADPSITHVAVVHCETTSGIMNPVEEIGQVVREHKRIYFVDSMSAFGGVEFDFTNSQIDVLVSSANKCIEGVPGFGFAICRRELLDQSEGYSRTVSLDLVEQWKGLEGNGQFRFTPPTHALLAFHQALAELTSEGGVAGRAARYRSNYECLIEGMNQLGFREYVPRELQGHIITSFLYPDHPKFEFSEFYQRLNDKGFVIYPGKVSDAECFRIGHIGRLSAQDTRGLLAAIGETLDEMGVELPSAQVIQ